MIDNRLLEKAKKIALRLDYEYTKHNGKWLDQDAVDRYRDRFKRLNVDGQNHGEFRELRLEFQEEYGLTEAEATNILRGYNIADYLHRYHMIRDKIPLRDELKEVNNKDELIRIALSELTKEDKFKYKERRERIIPEEMY